MKDRELALHLAILHRFAELQKGYEKVIQDGEKALGELDAEIQKVVRSAGNPSKLTLFLLSELAYYSQIAKLSNNPVVEQVIQLLRSLLFKCVTTDSARYIARTKDELIHSITYARNLFAKIESDAVSLVMATGLKELEEEMEEKEK